MTPIQQLMLGAGGAKKKTYLEDVFSNYIYNANQGNYITVNNGIDLAGEGGLVWGKRRDGAEDHVLCDTERGALKYLASNSNGAPQTDHGFSSYNSNGFTVNNASRGAVNQSNFNYITSTFRKAPGFFDVVTYTGDGASSKTISHSLGSIPGLIMVKRTDSTGTWVVYHKSLGNDKVLYLDMSDAKGTNMDQFDKTDPTASSFTVEHTGTGGSDINVNGATYVAYIFAGGESTAATARSVDFDGSGDYLSTASTSDLSMGTGDFTIECWWKPDHATNNEGVFHLSPAENGLSTSFSNSLAIGHNASTFTIYGKNTDTSFGMARTAGHWHHIAYVRSSGVSKVYVNGIEKYSTTDTTDYAGSYIAIGGYYNTSYLTNGNISNFRVVKGTAVYTSSFRPPTEPLTNITNTVLLCCNNSSTTGKTVGPTLTAHGDPTASTDSPFDDPAGFVFGENGDQGIIKCGTYVGNDNADGPEINLGWEPQWLLIKRTNQAEDWLMFDSLRGIPTGGDDSILWANEQTTEETNNNRLDLTPTGFKITTGLDHINLGDFIYVAIRRPDGYVGKPADAGTDVFNVTAADTTLPAFNANFAVDFSMYRRNDSGGNWVTSTRLNGHKYLRTDEHNNEEDLNIAWYAYNDGFSASDGFSTNRKGWLWKRHAGLDVVTYKGNSTGNSSGISQNIPHSLNAIPEMMWVKCRNDNGDARSWFVYHKGLNGGTTPEQWNLKLNSTTDEAQDSNRWNDDAPTSTHFTVGAYEGTNASGDNYIAMLFASVDGISKVGSYTGAGSSTQTITTGFTPRLIIIKSADDSWGWAVFDSERGLTSGSNDPVLYLNSSSAEASGNNYIPTVSSTGFTVMANGNLVNQDGDNYIYYAHA